MLFRSPPEKDTVLETVIDVQDIQEESEEDADEIISVCIALYEKASDLSFVRAYKIGLRLQAKETQIQGSLRAVLL